MTRAEELRALAERVEREEASRYLDAAIMKAIGGSTCPLFTASVDAAKTLEREGWAVVVNIAREGTACTVVDRPIPSVLGSAMSTGPHAEPRARVSASLRALAAEAERGQA